MLFWNTDDFFELALPTYSFLGLLLILVIMVIILFIEIQRARYHENEGWTMTQIGLIGQRGAPSIKVSLLEDR
ncbi:hypothetical protein JL09_g5100 [Pichia kudriavzevii]|uniref:Uncharacterized protein n=2 Tax=Pichia kudriavzevii TaxID=4909 RepID=A0A099NT20_PICKU|nr:hypothetical protein JL09_g5100 [Pichia kudriavzevii]